MDRDTFRYQFLSIVKRRIKPANGSDYKYLLLQTQTQMKIYFDLSSILKGIQWAVVGGVATRNYIPERETKDLDILIDKDSFTEVKQRLMQNGCTYINQLYIVHGEVWKLPDGTELDILAPDEEWVGEALQNTQKDPQGFPVVTLPYLTLMKLLAGRSQDIADITRMLGIATEDVIAETSKVIKKYYPDAMEDLKSIIQLGRLEWKQNQ
jgi:hypothetical protein